MGIVNSTENLKYVGTEVKPERRIFTILSKITFTLYIVAIFFGTSPPFRERVKDVEDIATSNIMNQLVFTTLFILSVITIIPRFKSFFEIIYKEKMLVIFFLWALLSIAWSDYSFTSFKRWFQVITSITVAISILMYTDDHKDLLKYFKVILFFYLIISIASVFVIPNARGEGGAWRGLAPSKNHLGQAALLNIIIWSLIFYYDNLKWKVIDIIMIIIAVLLLVGASSSTSMTAFMFIIFLAAMSYVDKLLKPIKVGRLFSILGLFTAAAIVLSVVFLARDILVQILASFGEDLTFTGRTDLWADILREANKHLWIGCGFQGFWIVENNDLLALYDRYIWFPNQAHNGYIDILNEVGIIGLALFVGVIANYFLNIRKLKNPTIFKWFVIVAIIVNFQESTFIRPQVLTGVFFIFSYLALFVQLHKEKKEEYEELLLEENTEEVKEEKIIEIIN
ncbi:MAG: O-antigen ligase family protein [Syntrophothermus sp.]